MTALARLLNPAVTYQATIVSVTDGDTFNADVRIGNATIADLDVGLTLYGVSIRIVPSNAWERATDAGKAAKANLTLELPPGMRVTLSTVKADKWRMRMDARVALPDGQDLAALLIATGWAAWWDGKGSPAPVPPWPRTT